MLYPSEIAVLVSVFHVYILNGLKLWESHPFTIASWTNSTIQAEKGDPSQNTCVFAVRPHDGFTARLRDQILRRKDTETSNTGESGTQIRVVMEGPYGICHSTQAFDSALLIISGSGISVALAHVRHICEAVHNKKEAVALRKIHLIWAVHDQALFQDHFDHEIALLWPNGPESLASKINVQISLYVTGQKDKSQSRSSSPTDSTRSESLEKSDLGPSAKHIDDNNKTAPSMTGVINKLPAAAAATDLDSRISIFTHRPDVHDLVITTAQADAVKRE